MVSTICVVATFLAIVIVINGQCCSWCNTITPVNAGQTVYWQFLCPIEYPYICVTSLAFESLDPIGQPYPMKFCTSSKVGSSCINPTSAVTNCYGWTGNACYYQNSLYIGLTCNTFSGNCRAFNTKSVMCTRFPESKNASSTSWTVAEWSEISQ